MLTLSFSPDVFLRVNPPICEPPYFSVRAPVVVPVVLYKLNEREAIKMDPNSMKRPMAQRTMLAFIKKKRTDEENSDSDSDSDSALGSDTDDFDF